jgi:hypothetical protein
VGNNGDIKALMMEIEDLRAQVAALVDDGDRKDRRISRLEHQVDYHKHQINIIRNIAGEDPELAIEEVSDESDEPPSRR